MINERTITINVIVLTDKITAPLITTMYLFQYSPSNPRRGYKIHNADNPPNNMLKNSVKPARARKGLKTWGEKIEAIV